MFQYTRASSMLSCGGLRHQFSLPENVQMSMYTTEFLQYYREHLSVIGKLYVESQKNNNNNNKCLLWIKQLEDLFLIWSKYKYMKKNHLSIF